MRKYTSLLFLYIVLLGVATAIALKDVSPTLPEYEAVKFMVSKGIMDAENGYFKGPQLVTKFDLAVYLYKFYKYMVYLRPMKVSQPVVSPSPSKTEESSTSSYSKSEGEKTNGSDGARESVRVISDQRVDIILSLLKYNPKENDFDRIKDLEKKLIALNDLVSSLSKSLEKVPDISAIDNKVSELSKKVDSLEKKVKDIDDKYAKLEDSLSQSKNEIKKINEQLKIQDDKINENKESLNEIKSSYADLKERYNTLAKELNSFKNELDMLKSMMASYATKIDSHENTLQNVLYQLSELSDELKTAAMASTPVSAVPKTAVSTPVELGRYIKEIESIKSKVESIDKLKSELQSKLEEVNSLLKEVNSAVEKVKGTNDKVNYIIKSNEVLAANQKKMNSSLRNLFILTIFSVVLSVTAILVSFLF